MSGPISVASSSGAPRVMRSVAATKAATKSSYAERSTRMRLRAQQSWPALPNTAMGVSAAARSTSASANTTQADLPPSSSDTRVMLSAEA